jgi:4-carboxymuconolactone decarboxylase
MKSATDIHRTGLELMARVHGGRSGEELVRAVSRVCPDFATMTVEWAMSGVLGRPGLDLLTRELLLVAACTTIGHVVPQLRAHIDAARRLGASREQIVETILQMLFYAGGAAVANALLIAGEVLDEEPGAPAGTG